MRFLVKKICAFAKIRVANAGLGLALKRPPISPVMYFAGIGVLALSQLVTALPAISASTGAWTPTANGGSATAAGVTVTISGIAGVAPVPVADTFNTTNFWVNPYGASPAGQPSISVLPNVFGVTQTVTFTFSKPVDNPVLHVDRLGGTIGTNRSTSVWTLSSFAATGGSVAVSRLGGDNEFIVSGNAFRRSTSTNVTGAECTTSNSGSTCGSIQYVGTGITSLTFTVTWADQNNNIGDQLEFIVSIPDTTVILRKQ